MHACAVSHTYIAANASTLAHSLALTRSSRCCKCMYTDALPRTATLIHLPGGGSSMVVQSSSFSMNGRQVQVPLRELQRSPGCVYARAQAHAASAGLGLRSSDGLGLGFRSLPTATLLLRSAPVVDGEWRPRMATLTLLSLTAFPYPLLSVGCPCIPPTLRLAPCRLPSGAFRAPPPQRAWGPGGWLRYSRRSATGAGRSVS